jgi:hypothetical protein
MDNIHNEDEDKNKAVKNEIDTETKAVLESFFESMISSLGDWVSGEFNADRVSRCPDRMFKIEVRRLNTAIHTLRNELNNIIEFYKDIENEFGDKFLGAEYMEGFDLVEKDTLRFLEKAKKVSQAFTAAVERAKTLEIDINSLISVDSQNSLKFMEGLNEAEIYRICEREATKA